MRFLTIFCQIRSLNYGEKVTFIPLFTQKEKSFIIVFAADARQCMPPNPARTGM